jgi:RHS repeat-associated protein
VSWSGISSPTATDWIGIYAVGAPNTVHQGWRYTTGAASGTVPFTVSPSVGLGNYQFRLFANNGYTLIGISDVFVVAHPTKTVSGTVTRSGTGLAGVAFSASNGGSCTASNASGQYTCTVAHGWSGTVTPSLGTNAFSPASRSYSNVTANQSAQDYALVLVTVSGTVSTGGSPQQGVTFAATGGETCTTSNASGQYTCTVPQNWTGSVTPSFGLYVFSPASRSYSSIASNQSAEDYAATPPVSISGTVQNAASAPFAGATFTAATGGICTQSNAAGQYSCQVASGWSGTVTPTQVGQTFTPASNSYASITTNQTTQDYATAGIADSATIFYIHPDHLNTPRLIENAAQQAVWRNDNAEPFGNSPVDENPSGLGAFEFPLRFPGQYADKESNLHYNYFRDYDPIIGRYVQSDPLGVVAGTNTYLYAIASPLRFIDPPGLQAWSFFGQAQFHVVNAGANVKFGFGRDSKGVYCFQTVNCGRLGPGASTGLTCGIERSSGDFKEGKSASGGFWGSGGFGPFASWSVTTDYENVKTSASIGVGGGIAFGGQICTTETFCINPK